MRSLWILALPLALSACGNTPSNAASPGPKGARTFSLADFDRVELKGSDDVRVTNGSGFAVSAAGPQKRLDDLDIRVVNGTLIVSHKSKAGWKLSTGEGVIVSVTMPLIKSAELAGSGNLSVDTASDAKFEGSISGSGDLTLSNLKAVEISLNLAGSGDIKARGVTKSLKVDLAGSGDVDVKDLSTNSLSASITGSGDVDASASGKAEVSLVGSGDVRILGTDDCTTSKIGSGRVTCSAL
jgi:Putative auto-transporter adhesin, head GIN domain